MIVTAITLLAVVAIVPIVVALGRSRIPSWRAHSTRVDVGAGALLITLAGVAALFALPAAHAAGAGLVIARICALAAAVTGGAPVVRSVLAAGGVVPRPPGDGNADPDAAGPLRGGRVIGYLERLAVAGTLLAGWPEGLAIILAVKSLARFPELRAPHASEQFIMGTFASVLWAVSMVGIGHLIVV